MNFKKVIAAGAISLIASGAAAQGFKTQDVYVGGGLSKNSLSGFDDATGYQIFGGYKFKKLPFKLPAKVKLAGELGYMTSGDFKFANVVSTSADGLWGAAVADYRFNPKVSGLLRLGLDIGDDDGLLYGLGGEYDIQPRMAIRGEFVKRDNVDSIQINFVYDLK